MRLDAHLLRPQASRTAMRESDGFDDSDDGDDDDDESAKSPRTASASSSLPSPVPAPLPSENRGIGGKKSVKCNSFSSPAPTDASAAAASCNQTPSTTRRTGAPASASDAWKISVPDSTFKTSRDVEDTTAAARPSGCQSSKRLDASPECAGPLAGRGGASGAFSHMRFQSFFVPSISFHRYAFTVPSLRETPSRSMLLHQ